MKNFKIALFVSILLSGVLLFVSLKLNTQFAQIDDLQEIRVKSIVLADELRQSSDDLTRFARTYVLTADNKYLDYYNHILKIRNGEVARPNGYEYIFWDLVCGGDTLLLSSDLGEASALKERMKNLGFTNSEFRLLETAQNRSDNLVKIEQMAFGLVQEIQKLSDESVDKNQNLQLAKQLLFNQRYLDEKAKIMTPIKQFQEQVDIRTNESLESIKAKTKTTLKLVYSLAGLVFFSLCILLIFSFRTKK